MPGAVERLYGFVCVHFLFLFCFGFFLIDFLYLVCPFDILFINLVS